MTYFVVHAPVAVDIAAESGLHGAVVAQESHAVAVAEHEVVEVDTRQNTFVGNTLVFQGTVKGILLPHNLVVCLGQFLAFAVVPFLEELHRICQLHIFGLYIHDGADCIVQQPVPLFVRLLFRVKVTVRFSRHEMNRDFRSGFHIIGKIVQIHVSRFLHVDNVHSFAKRDFLFLQSPAFGVFGRFESGSGLAHPVGDEQADVAAVQIAHQHHILTLFHIRTGHVFVTAVTIVQFQDFLQRFVGGYRLVSVQQIFRLIISGMKLFRHLFHQRAAEFLELFCLKAIGEFGGGPVCEVSQIFRYGLGGERRRLRRKVLAQTAHGCHQVNRHSFHGLFL